MLQCGMGARETSHLYKLQSARHQVGVHGQERSGGWRRQPARAPDDVRSDRSSQGRDHDIRIARNSVVEENGDASAST